MQFGSTKRLAQLHYRVAEHGPSGPQGRLAACSRPGAQRRDSGEDSQVSERERRRLRLNKQTPQLPPTILHHPSNLGVGGRVKAVRAGGLHREASLRKGNRIEQAVVRR